MAKSQFLADTLKTFLFSLSQGMGAAAQAPGRRGTNLGMAAALGAPMQLQDLERQRQMQEDDRQQRIEAARAATRRGDIEDAVKILNALQGSVAPEVQVNAPVATPSPIGTMDGGTFQPPSQGGGTMGVPTPLKPVEIPGYGMAQPQSAQQMAVQKANELRQQAQLEQEMAPPPAPAAPPPDIAKYNLWADQQEPSADRSYSAYLRFLETLKPAGAQGDAGFTLSPGQARYDASGKRIASVPATATGAAAPAGQLSGIAQAALRDPSIIRGLTPTQRGEVYGELAKVNQLPQTQFAGVIDRGIETVELLKTMPGKSGAVGAKRLSSGFGLLDRPLPGTPEADYRLKVDQLISLLTLPELEMMKGLGAMSDREFNTLSRAATSLSTEGSEAGYDAELKRVEDVFLAMKARRSTAPTGGGPSEALIQANMKANPGMTRQQVIDELSK